MATVKVRLAPADISARMDKIRRWLAAHGIRPVKLYSTGSSDETVLVAVFASDVDAARFAEEFAGGFDNSS